MVEIHFPRLWLKISNQFAVQFEAMFKAMFVFEFENFDVHTFHMFNTCKKLGLKRTNVTLEAVNRSLYQLGYQKYNSQIFSQSLQEFIFD
jgi:hypothetical protein